MLSVKQLYYFYFFSIAGIYFYINIPVVTNCVFIADDLPVIFFSNLNPFPFATYWENGIQLLIPSVQIEANHYRPLTSFFTYACYLMFGLKPFYWSIVSQLIHILNFLLFIKVLQEIQKIFEIKKLWLCFFLPVFYLFYPANITNLAWLSARTDLIVILFCLLSFFFSLQYIQKKKITFLIISSLLFLLGAFAKENAISWFIVEFMLIWQIYFLCNKSSAIFTSLVRLLNGKLTAGIIYIFGRSILAGIDNKTVFSNIKIFSAIPAYFKSLLFTFLPVDSGTFIYAFTDSEISFILQYIIYFAALGFTLYYLLPRRDLSKMFFIGISISLSTLSFYVIAGGGTYRLFALTFTSLLIFLFNLLCFKENIFRSVIFKTASAIIIFFFILGSVKISNYWITNFKLQDESLESLIKIYDKNKNNIVLNYPHALGQSYCYSDIGIYLYYKVNNKIGRYNNIEGLAAINSHDAEHYLKGSFVEKSTDAFYISSEFNDTYFSPEPFFTTKSILGEKYNNLKNFSFEVVKLNSFLKPTGVKLQMDALLYDSANYIKFMDGKFERL